MPELPVDPAHVEGDQSQAPREAGTPPEGVIDAEVVDPHPELDTAVHDALQAPVEGADFEASVKAALVEYGRRHLPSGTDVFIAARHGLDLERGDAIAKQLGEQKLVYETATREQLIDACLDRDAVIANLSRQVADGRLGGRLLREFVRGILQAHDIGDRQYIEDRLRELGAENASRRQIALKGTTL